MSKATTALILGDLQNDFLHPEGAYGRAGQSCAEIAALPEKLAPLVQAARQQRHPHRWRHCSRWCPGAAASRSSRRI